MTKWFKTVFLLLGATTIASAQTTSNVTFFAPGTHRPFDASKCISVWVNPVLKTSMFEVFITNGCKVDFSVVRVALKYFDSSDFRIGSDSDNNGILIPSFSKDEKVKKTLNKASLVNGTVRIELRDIVAIQ